MGMDWAGWGGQLTPRCSIFGIPAHVDMGTLESRHLARPLLDALVERVAMISWPDGIFLVLLLSLGIIWWLLDDHPPEGPD